MSTVDEPSTTSPLLRARSEDDLPDERAAKRQKIRQEDDGQAPEAFEAPDPTKYLEPSPDEEMTDALATVKEPYNLENVLPQSRTLMRLPPAPEVPPDGFMHRTCEIDVGISQYIGQGLSAINGIIKQRYLPIPVLFRHS
jgi:tRNA pseudouridine13 synthase